MRGFLVFERSTMSKKIGVIGGLGTDTAAQFYVDTERLWHNSGAKSHIPLMLENIQSSFDLEQALIKGEGDRIGELEIFLCDAAKNLEQAGASFLSLPCNTAHVHIESLRNSVKIPALSITEETARTLKKRGFKTAAILGTRITRNSGIYEDACKAVGIKIILPDQEDQLRIEKIISRALLWKTKKSDTKLLLNVIDNVRSAGADGVVLACTDLQLIMPKKSPNWVIDSMSVLAEASVKKLQSEESFA